MIRKRIRFLHTHLPIANTSYGSCLKNSFDFRTPVRRCSSSKQASLRRGHSHLQVGIHQISQYLQALEHWHEVQLGIKPMTHRRANHPCLPTRDRRHVPKRHQMAPKRPRVDEIYVGNSLHVSHEREEITKISAGPRVSVKSTRRNTACAHL
jgi:hypothetical protein